MVDIEIPHQHVRILNLLFLFLLILLFFMETRISLKKFIQFDKLESDLRCPLTRSKSFGLFLLLGTVGIVDTSPTLMSQIRSMPKLSIMLRRIILKIPILVPKVITPIFHISKKFFNEISGIRNIEGYLGGIVMVEGLLPVLGWVGGWVLLLWSCMGHFVIYYYQVILNINDWHLSN